MKKPDYILDLKSVPKPNASAARPQTLKPGRQPGRRHWLSMHYRCCHAYGRLYLNPMRTAYFGTCPKCGASAKVRVSEDGSDCHFFSLG